MRQIEQIDQTLQAIASQISEIEAIGLVSSQGQPLTPSIGMDENSTLILAGNLLHFAEQIQAELNWQDLEHISIRSLEGSLTLVPCHDDVFLLIKTLKAPAGFLERDIKLAVRKLQAQLSAQERVESNPERFGPRHQELAKRQVTAIATLKSSANLDPALIARYQEELAQFIGPIASLVCQRLLSQKSNLSVTEFVAALAKHIPEQEQALAFQERLLSWSANSIPSEPEAVREVKEVNLLDSTQIGINPI
jgi:predicted regulator of Ras-like GTPase activity (Roadblock/LC7/MglB family)